MFYKTELENNFPTLRDDVGYEQDDEFYPSVVDAMVRYMESKGIDANDFVKHYSDEMC